MSSPVSHGSRWLPAGFAMSAAGAMLTAMTGILIKLIYVYHVDTITLLAARMLLSLPVFMTVGILEWQRRPVAQRPGARDIGRAALVGILGYYVSAMLDFHGLHTVEAQTERLILFTYPFLVILFGRVLLGYPLRPRALIGAVLSYAGLIVILGADPARLTPAMLGGAGLVLTAAATFALYQLFAGEMILRCGPSLFTAIGMSGAGAVILLQFGLTRDIDALLLPAPAWILMGAMAVFSTILPIFLMSAGTARIGAQQGTAIVSMLSPVLAIILAILVLDEPFGPAKAAGTALVLGGVGLFTLIESRRAARTP